MRAKYLGLKDIIYCLRDKMYGDAKDSEEQNYTSGAFQGDWDDESIFNNNEPILHIIERELRIELEKKTENYFSIQELECYFNGTENEYLLTAFDNIQQKINDYPLTNASPEDKLKELEQKYESLKEENIQIKAELDLKNKINFGFETEKLRVLAIVQKKFWPDSVEPTPPVIRKTVMHFIVDELELKLDKNSDNRQVQEWIKIISPD